MCPKVECRCGLCRRCAETELGSWARPTLLLLLLLLEGRGACIGTAKLSNTAELLAVSGPTQLPLPSRRGAHTNTVMFKTTRGPEQSQVAFWLLLSQNAQRLHHTAKLCTTTGSEQSQVALGAA